MVEENDDKELGVWNQMEVIIVKCNSVYDTDDNLAPDLIANAGPNLTYTDTYKLYKTLL